MDNSLKDRILESVDIVEVIGERVALRRKGREYVGLCPFHADHNPSMFVSPQKRIFKCWACGAGGDVIRFVQLSERCGFREALESLGRRVGIEPGAGPRDDRAARMRDQLLAAMKWARQHFERNFADQQRGRMAREYAERRGLSEETVGQVRLGYAADDWDDLLSAGRRAGLAPEVLESAGLITTSERGKTYDRFRNRLMFPIADALGRVVAFGGRTLGDDAAKYLNSPETVLFSKSRVLYGLDLARGAIQEQRAAVVVEGYMDAVMLRQHGVGNVVATLGTALTDAHVKLMRGSADVIYLCFDGDEAGVRAADRAVEVALQHPVEVRVVLLEGGQDPADCVLAEGREGFEGRLKAARDALEFKWSQTLSSFSTAAGADRRQALEAYLRFVAQVGLAGGVDPLEQNLLIGRLGELLGVPPEAVFDMLSSQKRQLRRGLRRGSEEADAGRSEYEASVAGVPGGLVATMETILGLLLQDSSCWGWVDDVVARGAGHSQTWQELYRVLLDVHEEVGEYSLGEIVSRCESAAVCELVDRAGRRVTGITSASAGFQAARDRLASELDVIRMAQVRGHLDPEEESGEEAFADLVRMARGQRSALPPEARWNSPA